jgi:leucyl/phenylalanyl-tRNA--protein transferase
MLYLLDPHDPAAPFPDASLAETEPNGLLAVGGDLSSTRLLNAYRNGIFPWYSDGQPLLWWSPDPRSVLFPEQLKISRSLRKTLRRAPFRVSMDRDFAAVVQACAAPRRHEPGTWITPAMAAAYSHLHTLGHAHSVEVWQGLELVGGLYGVAIGQVFFGESMFSHATDASKVAMVYLVAHLLAWGYRLIDCQVYSEHLISQGAEEISRRAFIAHLADWCEQPGHPGEWHCDPECPAIPASNRQESPRQ